MDIRHEEKAGHRGIEVVVTSSPGDERAKRIVERLQMDDQKMLAYEPGSIERRIIPLEQISLIEVRDERIWIITETAGPFESPLRLYEIEESLEETEFVRVSKQVIVNFDKVISIRPELNQRLMLGLSDGSRALVTRTYATDIKRRLGISR